MLTFDQISSPLPLMGTEGMQDSISDLVVLGIPEAGTIVQNRHQIGMGALQPIAQGLSKQRMIAIAPTLVIQRYNKEIGLLEPFEQLLTASLLHHGITERSGEVFEDAGREQKRLYLLWLSSQHLLSQKVEDVTLIATGHLQ